MRVMEIQTRQAIFKVFKRELNR
nr:unnamed protein product [Callosobruchus chinensis]